MLNGGSRTADRLSGPGPAMRALLAAIAITVVATACRTGEGSTEVGEPPTSTSRTELDGATAGPLSVSASTLERIGAGRAVTAASNGATTAVATAVGVHVVDGDGAVQLPVTTTGAATGVAIAPGGDSVLVSWPDATELWGLTGDPALLATERDVLAAGYTADDRVVLLSPSLIQILEASTGTLLDEVAPEDGTAFDTLAVDALHSTWFATMSTGDETASPSTAAVIVRSGGAPTIVPLDLPESFVASRSVIGPSGHHMAIAGVDRSVGAEDVVVMWDADLGATAERVTVSSSERWDVGADGALLISADPESRLVQPDGTSTTVAVSSGASDMLSLPTGVHALADGGFVTVWQDGGHTVHDGAGRVIRRDDGTGRTVVSSTASTGRSGLTTVDYDGVVRVLGTDGNPVRELSDFVAPGVNAIAIADDQRVAVATTSGSVSILGTDQRLALAHPEGSVTTVAFSPDGQRLVTGVGARRGPNAFDDTVSVWDLSAGDRLRTTGGGGEDVPGCLRFENTVVYAPDGSFFAAASHDFTVDLVDAETGEVRRVLQPQGGPLRDLTISPDGTRLVTSTDDAGLRIWDIGTGALLAEYHSGIGGYFDIAYLPDGSALVGINATGHLTTIDLATGATLTDFESIASRDAPLAVSPDGRLVMAAEGPTVRLWATETGQLLAELPGHSETVTAAAFDADGSQLVSGAGDGTVTVWALEVTGGG